MSQSPLSRSGVFASGPDALLQRFSQSVSFDRRLARQDIRQSQAHVQMLAAVGLLTQEEAQRIRQTLDQIGQEIQEGRFQFREELEDVHMNIEQALIDRLGDLGRKLHTARSRNDQVSTDLRLWCREQIQQICGLIRRLQRAFLDRCQQDQGVILPAYTHLQRAQPVLAAHYWLAYCERFERDRQRLQDALRRVNQCPLGTAALAGTSLPVDRHLVARLLEFDAPTANSLDSSGDRDFVLETAFALAMVALHLSGWAEEWILWSSVEFGFLRLPEELCTGSSIMPQKVNPDPLELIRGKTGRVVGALTALLVLLKGLPLAYNRDLQEDKPPLFDAFDTLRDCLEIAAAAVARARLCRERIAAGLEEGYLDATTLMEYFIARGMPQRAAHHAVGQLVRQAMEQKVPLKELPLEAFQALWPEVDQGVYDVLGVERAVQAFRSYGSTAPEQVQQQIRLWQERLEQE